MLVVFEGVEYIFEEAAVVEAWDSGGERGR